ncbi:hypothetical protein [Haladaptatus salinisoli]|uniref:hypothetical protein n=1 Tax=Haladaptatus salinisoli TaxID=2884876 RepID=UPI00210414C3|nr:hypothetical protein [Haladaptatus salinisoli]
MAAARDALSSAQLFYDGGIHDYNSVYEMASVADTIIVDYVLPAPGSRRSRKPFAEQRMRSTRHNCALSV